MKTSWMAVFVFLMALRLQAAVVIDSYSSVAGGDPDSVQTIGASFGTPVDFIISPTVTDPVGSRRRLSVDQFVGGQSATLSIDGSGSAILGSTGGAASTWTINYGVGFPGLHFDATAGGATGFRLIFDSVGPGHEYVIGASGYTANGTSNAGTYQPLTSVVEVPFSSFSNSGSINFGDLNQIQIIIRNSGLTHGGTSSLTQFETFTVPEPSKAMSLAVAGAFLLLRRRRQPR